MELRQKHDALQQELASRKSIEHFARCAISILVALIIFGAAGKMFWDARELVMSLAALAVGSVSLGLLMYAAVQYVVAKRLLRHEHLRVAEFTAVRRELRVDDPPALLPSR